MTDLVFAPGHVFFRPGDPPDRAYLLEAGHVELLAGDGDAPTRVALFGPGDVFGEMALVEERPRALTALAATAGRATPMTRDDFEHILTHDPARARRYLRSLFERLRSLTARAGAGAEPGRPAPLVPVASPERSGPAELPGGPGRTAGWVVVVHPLTPKAGETLPDGGLRVTRFPLRIGRASGAHEREAFDLNDVWLLDSPPFNVSRNHCDIDVDLDGPVVRDRGSHVGCVVNDEVIGGRVAKSYAPLRGGDNVVVVGTRTSPYQFRVTVGPA